jgi:hypothetical protein
MERNNKIRTSIHLLTWSLDPKKFYNVQQYYINYLKTKNNLNYIEGPSSYRSVNNLRLDYENQ